MYGIVVAASVKRPAAPLQMYGPGTVSRLGGPHIVDTDGVTVNGATAGLTLTTVVALTVHVPLLSVTVYVPALAAVTGVTVAVSEPEALKLEGPAHVTEVYGVPPAVPVSVTVPPGQTAPLLVADIVIGQGDQRKIELGGGKDVKPPFQTPKVAATMPGPFTILKLVVELAIPMDAPVPVEKPVTPENVLGPYQYSMTPVLSYNLI